MNLNDLISWHKEQFQELEREENVLEYADFHSDAVALLETLQDDAPIPYSLTAKGLEAVEGAK